MEDFCIDKIKQILNKNNIAYTFAEPRKDRYGYDHGYVDHGGELNEFISDVCNDEDRLLRYLFSNESFIITGNDNDDEDVSICVNYPHEDYYKGN